MKLILLALLGALSTGCDEPTTRTTPTAQNVLDDARYHGRVLLLSDCASNQFVAIPVPDTSDHSDYWMIRTIQKPFLPLESQPTNSLALTNPSVVLEDSPK